MAKERKSNAGRPTSYSKELVEKAYFYLDNYKDIGHPVPIVAGLAVYLNVHSDTLYNWAKDEDKPEFFGILNAIRDKQHVDLVSGGLNGEFSSPIAKMMMTKHGYSDKQEVDQTVKGEHKHTHEVSAVDKFADVLKEFKTED